MSWMGTQSEYYVGRLLLMCVSKSACEASRTDQVTNRLNIRFPTDDTTGGEVRSVSEEDAKYSNMRLPVRSRHVSEVDMRQTFKRSETALNKERLF